MAIIARHAALYIARRVAFYTNVSVMQCARVCNACATARIFYVHAVCPAGLPRKLRLCVGGEPPAMASGGGIPPLDDVVVSQTPWRF